MSGRSTGASSITTAFRGRRSASAARTWLAVSCSPAAGGAGAAGAARGSGGGSLSLRDGGGQLPDHGRDRGEHAQLRRAAVHLVRVVADDGDPRAGLGESPRDETGLPERRSADDEHRVVGGELGPKPGAVGGEHSLVGGVVLRKACPCAECLLEDGRAELLGELDERRPRRRVVRAGADDERRPLGGAEERGERVHRFGVGTGRAQHRAAGGGGLALLVGGLAPVAHRHDHESRSPARRGGVVGALDRGRHVVRGGRASRPTRGTCPPARPAGPARNGS